MRKKRPDLQCRGDYNSQVRGIESTQLDLEPDWSKPHVEDTRESNASRHYVGLQADSNWEEVTGKSYLERTITSCRSVLSGCRTSSDRPGPLHLTPPSRVFAREQQLQQLSVSDDTNKNALSKNKAGAEQILSHRFLNQDNSAAGSFRRKSRTNEKKAINAKSRETRDHTHGQHSEIDIHRVIQLPPNSILKITSRSSLNREKQHKHSADETKCRARSLAKGCLNNKRSATCSNLCSKQLKKSDKINLKAGNGSGIASPREVNKSNSSRYRVTPCPTSASDLWSGQDSPRSCSSKKTCRPTSPDCRMNNQSFSTGLTDGLFGKSSTEKDSTASKRHKRPYTRRNSASGKSNGVSRHASLPRRQGKYLSASSSRDSPSGLFFNISGTSKSRTSSRLGARKMHRMSPLRGRRSRTVPSSHRRRGKPTARRMHSTSHFSRKRGRPRGSYNQKSKKHRGKSWGSLTNHSSKAEGKGFGIFDTVSKLWRSYSFSQSARHSNSSSSCSETSWVSRILPGRRYKYDRQQEQHRERALKNSRARKAQMAESKAAEARRQRRLRSSDSGRDKNLKKEKRQGGPSVVCRIM